MLRYTVFQKEKDVLHVKYFPYVCICSALLESCCIPLVYDFYTITSRFWICYACIINAHLNKITITWAKLVSSNPCWSLAAVTVMHGRKTRHPQSCTLHSQKIALEEASMKILI